MAVHACWLQPDTTASVQPELGLEPAGRVVHEVLDVTGRLERAGRSKVAVRRQAGRIDDAATPSSRPRSPSSATAPLARS